jgi:two-component system, chemotaxis family, protein-glutamate methylesterase/glutaminase
MTRIVVIGASAGGIEALRTLVNALPADFPAPICLVMHISPHSPGILHDILNRSSRLTATNPKNNDRLSAGMIYVAPPDCHLLVEPGRVRVTKGPKENRFRPAIDPLFRSAARVFGPAAIGVILTGNLDDGTDGLGAVKTLGGTAIVQDPEDALFPSMPQSALAHVNVDYCVPLYEIPPLLVRLTREPALEPTGVTIPPEIDTEVRIAKEENPMEAGLERLGKPSAFACPDCHGVLLQLHDNGRIRFRCHTGHAFSLDSLLAALGSDIEGALWNAIRSLEETALFLDQLAVHMREAHGAADAEHLLERAAEARRHSEIVRQVVNAREPIMGEALKTP